jgi:hypothetical protein
LYDEYNDKVNFVQIYVIEPHPYGVTSPYGPYATFPGYWASLDIAGNPLHQPTSFAERFNQAQREQKELGVKIPVLVDEMNNPVWCTYGPLPNCAYLISTDGTVLERETWYQPAKMEAAIKIVLPIPNALLLFGTGLAGLLGLGWRKLN